MLSQDFKEFLKLLDKHKVEYLVVGGYAVAFHGHPRYTKDIDIWINHDEGNAGQLIKVLVEFGFASLGLKTTDFTEPGNIIQLGYPPSRIDLLTSVSGLKFNEAFERKITHNLGGTNINFICLDDLKTNKKETGRHQDMADLENLE